MASTENNDNPATDTASQKTTNETTKIETTDAEALSSTTTTPTAMENPSASAAVAPTKEPNNHNPDNNSDWLTQRDALKQAGDQAYREGDMPRAIQHYTHALALDPTHAPLWSNRSAAHLRNHSKSKALHDAEACRKHGMRIKGTSRVAAALQALGRWEAALTEWESILAEQPEHVAATKGVDDCRRAVERIKEAEEEKKKPPADAAANDTAPENTNDNDNDPLADFFAQADSAAASVTHAKQQEAAAATSQIHHHTQSLGTAADHWHRLVDRPNASWYNLNPFTVLDLPHTASAADIGRRYKALSLLLHPDKNRGANADQARAAFEILKTAHRALTADDVKTQHVRDLVATGHAQGRQEFLAARKDGGGTLEDYQKRATYKLFADREVQRRLAEKNTRAYEQREKEQEDAAVDTEQKERKFHKQWKQEERVQNRVGNWRDFQTKASNHHPDKKRRKTAHH